MSVITRAMENSLAYRLWQAPFADKKIRPVLQGNDVAAARRVLDVGCGPGTSTPLFDHAFYIGTDINEAYLHDARQRYGRAYVVADAGSQFLSGGQFDFILVNSLMHHLDTESVRATLTNLCGLLTDDGQIHILDLVLPSSPSPSRLLARLDRGDFPRPLETWRALFCEQFEPVIFDPYPLGMMGVTLWSMVYFKGRPRR